MARIRKITQEELKQDLEKERQQLIELEFQIKNLKSRIENKERLLATMQVEAIVDKM
jgi:ribosomal protein L29